MQVVLSLVQMELEAPKATTIVDTSAISAGKLKLIWDFVD